MKICVIGGGSSYSPELIAGFIESWDELPIKVVSLMDIDSRKLSIVGNLASRMVAAAGGKFEVETTTDQSQAVQNSSFVINQIRVGGLAARTLDEKIPPMFGVIGQETTGPGGFAKALRTIPVALKIANLIEALAPSAFLINFTNPAGLITEALTKYSSVPVIGLCNLPIGAKMRISEQTGVDPDTLQLDWVGLNHLNWIRGASIGGENLWGEIFEAALDEASQTAGNGWNFSVELLETLGMIPCGYLNYYYNHDLMLAKQMKAEKTRGEEVQKIEDQLMALYQDPKLTKKPQLLEERGGAYYSKAAVSLISSIANNEDRVHVVNTVNNGAIPDLPPEAVVEVACKINRSGAHPQPANSLPTEIRGLIQIVKAYEELTIIAGVEGDRRKALQALMAHPLVPSYAIANGLLDEILQAHRNHLPQFFPGD
jgi:6-phospho-beta-glucosidase